MMIFSTVQSRQCWLKWWSVNQIKIMWKKSVTAWFQVLAQHVPQKTVEKHKRTSVWTADLWAGIFIWDLPEMKFLSCFKYANKEVRPRIIMLPLLTVQQLSIGPNVHPRLLSVWDGLLTAASHPAAAPLPSPIQKVPWILASVMSSMLAVPVWNTIWFTRVWSMFYS